MLADAETVILPALLVILFLYPVSIWTLIRTLKARPNVLTIWCAALIATSGVVGVVAVLKDFEWPPDQGLVISVLFWMFPLLCGLVGLVRARKGKNGGKS